MGHLTAEERGVIEFGLSKGFKISQIALDLNRHVSTIYREIKRNSFLQGKNAIYSPYPYRAMNASNLATLRRKASSKPYKVDDKLIRVITTYLEKKWSPEQISKGLSFVKVTAKTIYNWIYLKIIPFDIKKLRRRGKHYHPKQKGTLLRRPDSEWFEKHSIERRPIAVNSRKDFGHWEADSVLSGRKGTGAIATFVERKTRKYVTYKMAHKNSECMYQAMVQLMTDFKGAVKSITCDRGSEFINSDRVYALESQNLTIYMAHPYSPQERGSNENHNGLLREYFPKGTNFNKVSQEELNVVTESINNRPRKILKWKTANKRFQLASSKATILS